eukprot:TRINITY_DN36_c0_g1_i11.p1 TRINITY_DN36_c0_g1~~TRINITY_DN36_c0_g1_i11.p1  ORF type:complete len:225 (+),score=115.52 TRINITY_DN36_c0_g1_i11:80-676(+)
MPKVANPKTLGNGVSFLSKGQRFHKKGLFNKAIRTKQPAATAAAAPQTKKVGGAKNGGSRVIKAKPSRFLLTPAERKAVSVSATKAAPKPVKLRATITPGTVLILVAGRFRSKRVVFLKQLPSGLFARLWPLQGQRCSPPPCRSALRDCHLHQGGRLWRQDPRVRQRRFLQEGRREGSQEVRGAVLRQGREEGSRPLR